MQTYTFRRNKIRAAGADDPRRGNVLVLAAGTLVLVFAFTAFTVDVGYIVLTKAELEKTSDAAALAASIELQDAFGPAKILTESHAEDHARTAASDVAAANRAGGQPSVYLDPNRDVRFGKYSWDDTSGTFIKEWGASPHNMVEATVRRDQAGSSSGDGPLDLFFGPVIGHDQANAFSISTVALQAGGAFRKIPGQNISILPIALDVETWDDLMAGLTGTDDYHYHESDGSIGNGGDGIFEVNLYPEGNVVLPPGNRGTVDFGSMGNSTADISRQILYGLNDDDWAELQAQGITELRWDTDPIIINGDTGLSAGIKDELEAIKGLPRAIPLFSDVSGPGNNAMYTIVRFVGIRIMYVKLTGNPSGKKVVIEPATFVDGSLIPGEVELTEDSIYSSASLIP